MTFESTYKLILKRYRLKKLVQFYVQRIDEDIFDRRHSPLNTAESFQ